jgi:dUTP pyrophosphatase
MKIKYDTITPAATIPIYATSGAAGADLVATSVEYRRDLGLIIYDTSLIVEIPEGYEGQIRARSSLILTPWYVPHGIGAIDSDYRGTIKVVYAPRYTDRNLYDLPLPFAVGERCAQLIIVPVIKAEFIKEEPNATIRQDKGFGSTGRAKLNLTKRKDQ